MTVYPLLIIASTIGKKSFENLGRLIGRSGDTVKRMLRPYNATIEWLRQLVETQFLKNRNLVLAIDDTLIKKIYSKWIVGTGRFYDTKICRKIIAYRLIVIMVTDGKLIIPIGCAFEFAKELVEKTETIKSKDEIVKELVSIAFKRFSGIKLRLAADGAYATKSFIKWCMEQKIHFEMRMANNRKVIYNGKKVMIREIKELELKGRQMARTVTVVWHEMSLFITVMKELNKHNEEVIKYLVSNYEAKPHEHAKTYKKRWGVEKAFRTSKQYLGLQECYSKQKEYQLSHIAAVFLAYVIAQLEAKKQRLKNPEAGIKTIKQLDLFKLEDWSFRLAQPFGYAYA
jgi:hypothetical protein